MEIVEGEIIKAIPSQAWTGPEGSRRLRLPDFKTTAYANGNCGRRDHKSNPITGLDRP